MPRTVLVTGGGSGIGRAIAARFAADGDAVTITGRRAGPLAGTAAALGATAVVCDHADPDALAAARAELPDRIDVLVNNAGGNTDFDAGEPADLAGLAGQWRANLAANLLGPVLTTAAVADRLADGGAVVHVGSIAAERGGAGAYGAAKAGLAAWNIDLAGQLGPRGITSNVVAAGYVEATGFFRDRMTDARHATLIGQTATGRAGTVDDVAAAAHFLASPGARHITAQVLHVNGGAWATR